MFRALIAGASILGGLSFFQRFWSRQDPLSPHGKDPATAEVLQVFAEAETAREVPNLENQWEPVRGLDQIVASKVIQDIPASTKLDFARSHKDTGSIKEFLGKMQRSAIEKAHANPESVQYGDPWKTAWTQIKRGSFIEGAGLVAEAPKRMLDAAFSRRVGKTDSFGRNFMRSIGVEEGETLFAPISGTIDAAGVILGDPTLAVGKATSLVRKGLTEGEIQLSRMGTKQLARRFAANRIIKDAETGKEYLNLSDFAVNMPGVRNWAKKVANEPVESVLHWEKLGGGVLDGKINGQDIRQLIGKAETPEQVQDILKTGLDLGQIYRLPVYAEGAFKNRLSLLGRAQYTNYGRKVWDDAIDLDDPKLEDNFYTLWNYFHKNTDEAKTWLADFMNAAPEKRVGIADRMVKEGLEKRAIELTAHQAKALGKKIGLKVNTWDELVEQATQGKLSDVRARAEALDIKLPDSGRIRGTFKNALRSIPVKEANDATDNLMKYASGYFTQKERAYGYIPGHTFAMPMLDTQLRQHMFVPSFQSLWMWEQELAGQATKFGRVKKFGADATYRLDKLMAPWRGVMTMTPRSQMRNLSDDTISGISHPYYGGRVLRNLAWSAWDVTGGMAHPGRPIFQFIKSIRSAEGQTAMQRFRRAVELTSLESSERTLKRAKKLGLGEKGIENARMPDRIRTALQYTKLVGSGVANDPELVAQLNARKITEVDWTNWTTVTRNNTAYPETWSHFVNHQVLQDDAVKIILANLDDPDRSKAMLRSFLESERGLTQVAMAKQAGLSPEDFIDAKYELIRYAIPDEIMDYAKSGYVPGEVLTKLWKKGMKDGDWGALPDAVTGPSFLFNASGNNSGKIIGSLSESIGKAVDYSYGVGGAIGDQLGRSRIYTEAYLEHYTRLRAKAAAMGKVASDEELAYRARRWAEREVRERVDDYSERTRIGTLSRGYASFLDAHLRFWKRWGRIAAKNPEHLEKMRLLFGAGESMGWIEPDDNGNLVFTVPVAPQLAAAVLPGEQDLYESWFSFTVGAASKGILDAGMEDGVAKMAENFGKVITPRGLPFSVDVIPGLSPVLSFPIDYLTLNHLPNLRGLAEIILGPAQRYDPSKAGITDSIIGSFIPAWAKDLGSIMEDEEHDVVKGNAVANALKYHIWKFNEDNGRLPTAEEQKEVYKKAQQTAKWALVGRVASRLFAPWSQSRVPYGKEMAEDWHHFSAEFGPEVGFTKFMDKYGEGAIGYTVPASKKTDGGAPLNYSEEAERFYVEQPEFFERYGRVAGFFTRDMPGFDLDVYGRMRSRGDRTAIPPKEILGEAFYRLGNREYYDKVRPAYLAQLANAQGEEERYAVSLWLDAQKKAIDEKYPGWSGAYAAAASNVLMRQKDMDELRMALEDPLVADMDATKAAKGFLRLYDEALSQANAKGAKTIQGRDFIDTRKWLAEQAANIYATTRSEGFQSIYEFLFRPQLERLEDDYITVKRSKPSYVVSDEDMVA